ncbi:MAG: DNA polymerase IV [Elusimicrobia bacterium]|nr:MAG: DNA polymerase IV [Elusimicrobiota bacterium]
MRESRCHPHSRLILHADLDAFFAAVEERHDPSLKGKPVIIGSDPKEGTARGIVATANYAARRFGVGSAMPISIAWRRCPNAIFIRPNGKRYRAASKAVMSILEPAADIFQKVGIDEAYLDVSSLSTFEAARKCALTLQKQIFEEEGLSISFGIGPNKLIAKIASDHKKPAGITVVIPSRILEFLEPKPVRALRGVGPKTAEHLESIGCRTVKDVRGISETRLVRTFGKFGHFLYREARGEDDRLVDPHWEAKSIGRERTFAEDTDDYERVMQKLQECVTRVHADLQGEGLWCHTMTVKIRFEGYETHSKQITLIQPSGSIRDMEVTAKKLAAPFLEGRRVRLIGFTVSRLVPPEDLLPLRD